MLADFADKLRTNYFFNKFLYPPLTYVRSRILYRIFNNESNNINFRYKFQSLIALLKSKLFLYPNDKVNLFILGAAKSGTTSLQKYLTMHSKILSPVYGKECHYFDIDSFFNNSNEMKNQSQYRAIFPKEPIGDNKYFLDATPNHYFYPNSIERIYKYNPTAKLILILRNPVDRAYSFWNMQYKSKKIIHSFEKNVELEFDLINNKSKKHFRSLHIIRAGLYSHYIEKIYLIFPKENVKIYFMEDLKNQKTTVLKNIFHFLNLKYDSEIFDEKNVKANSRIYKQKIPVELKSKLINFYKQDILNLEKLTNKKLDKWYEL